MQLVLDVGLRAAPLDEVPDRLVQLQGLKGVVFQAFRVVKDEHVINWRDDLFLNVMAAGGAV